MLDVVYRVILVKCRAFQFENSFCDQISWVAKFAHCHGTKYQAGMSHTIFIVGILPGYYCENQLFAEILCYLPIIAGATITSCCGIALPPI